MLKYGMDSPENLVIIDLSSTDKNIDIAEKEYVNFFNINKTLDLLSAIKIFYNYYITDSNYIYKSCESYIVVLKKIMDETFKTNENRSGIINENYAKFRANKVEVVSIFNKGLFTYQIDNIQNSHYPKKINYKVGAIIEINNFNDDNNIICAAGIHYYKTIDSAFYFNFYEIILTNKLSQNYYEWHDNGSLSLECTFLNGMLHGKYQKWDKNGTKTYDYVYHYDKLNGRYQKWYPNGNLMIDCKYKNDVLVDIYVEYYDNGNKSIEIIYNGSTIYKKKITWSKDGYLMSIYENSNKHLETLNSKYKMQLCKHFHKNGVLATTYTIDEYGFYDKCQQWFDTGKRKMYSTYVKNKLHGIYFEWSKNGECNVYQRYNNGNILYSAVGIYDRLKPEEQYLIDEFLKRIEIKPNAANESKKSGCFCKIFNICKQKSKISVTN